MQDFRPAGLPIAYSSAVWPFIIPAIVDGIGSAKSNKQLDADFAQKALSITIITPHCKIYGIVFVSTDMQFDEEFTLTVSDLSGNQFVLSTENAELAV